MRSLLIALAAVLLAPVAAAAAPSADPEPGTIAVIGDTPYGSAQLAAFPSDIAAINGDPAVDLVIHLGDIKNGSSRCDDSYFVQIRSDFDLFADPLVYTPGDNEWTDCDRPAAGAYDSEERLELIRATFFDSPRSFGQRRMRVEQQDAPYVENLRWRSGQVVYATLHVVGSDNNLGDVAPDPVEFAGRDAATNEWLRQTFAAARRTDAAGVLLVIQANPGFDASDPTRAPVRDPRTLLNANGSADGFTNFLRLLREETIAFGKPVVLVHGDSHYFRIDKPFQDEQGRRLENFTRLETPGDNAQNGNNDVHWVKVLVDPRERELFSFHPQTVPGNRVAVPAP
jgi:Calcineurin-like phosphoesterase